MAAHWNLVKSGTDRHTVYHACDAHQPSGLRLAVEQQDGVRWRWSVYDMTQGSLGGLLVAEGFTTTWASARRTAAGKALTIWKRQQPRKPRQFASR